MSIVSGSALVLLTFIIPPMAFYLGIHLGGYIGRDWFYGLPSALTVMGIAITLMTVILVY